MGEDNTHVRRVDKCAGRKQLVPLTSIIGCLLVLVLLLAGCGQAEPVPLLFDVAPWTERRAAHDEPDRCRWSAGWVGYLHVEQRRRWWKRTSVGF